MKKVIHVTSAVAIAAALGLGGLIFKAARKAPPVTNPITNEETRARQERDAEKAEKLESAITQSVQAVPLDRRPAAEGPEAPADPAFAGSDALADYVRMKGQIFMSAETRARKDELLRDEKFLKGLGQLLKTPASRDLKTQELQSQAIDLLIEARTATDGKVAGEVLKSVVEDASIENDKLKLAERKALAGLKAELLYQWTAQEPQVADSILSWLPGPISQKIWRNVLAAQEQNELASTQELQPRGEAQ